uniref:Uncharacterized protein n=1 Tax=Knipowitschia caucasica TaxID=637954 RepID=A0AAV2J0S8_KNICA
MLMYKYLPCSIQKLREAAKGKEHSVLMHWSSLRYCGMEYYIMYAMNTHGPQGSVSMSHWMTAVKISRGYSKVLLLIRP